MIFSRELMKGAAEVIVLQSLKDNGESYGYQLIKSIAEQSQDVFTLQEGTLYPLLYRLEFKGLVKSQRKATESGKARRYYRLTTKGEGVLKLRTKELGVFMKAMRGTLNLSV